MRFIIAGEYDRAITQIRRALELNPDFAPAYFDLGGIYVAKGMPEAAVRELRKAVALERSHGNLGYLGMALALSGDAAAARTILDELNERSASEYVAPIAFVWIYTGLGEHDLAFEWLERCFDDRNHFLTLLNSLPAFEPLRSDQRFAELVNRMNFPP